MAQLCECGRADKILSGPPVDNPYRFVDVSDEELQARLKEWRAPAPRYASGVMAKYARLVSCASVGAVTGY